MKQKELIAFLSGYALATILNSDQMVKLASEHARKSQAAKIEFGFELGSDILSLLHLGLSKINKHNYQSAFAFGYILSMANCLLGELFMPNLNTNLKQKYYIMENQSYQVILSLLNMAMLFYATYRYNKSCQIQQQIQQQYQTNINNTQTNIPMAVPIINNTTPLQELLVTPSAPSNLLEAAADQIYFN